MRNSTFIQLQTIRLAQSAAVEHATWTSCKKGMSLTGATERFWIELRGDVMLLYPGCEVVRQFQMYLNRRNLKLPEHGLQELLEQKGEHLSPQSYASFVHSFSSRVPKTKVVPILFRVCKKVARFDTRTITFTAYNASAIPFKSISLTFDTYEAMMLWQDVVCKVPEVYQKTLSDFSLIRHVGHGATSDVFLVRDRLSHKKLAMKAIEKNGIFPYHDSVRRIIDERIVHSRMRKHPYILEMSHAFETSERLYVATEYCSRGDLFHHLRRSGRTASEEKAKMVTAEILLALEALHDQGIWYRDLKPENVMVADNGHVKLGDFGATKITDPKRPVPRSNSAVGTVEYLAPEMASDKPYNRTVDLWAFGIFICELLNGETPFASDTEKLTYLNIKKSPLVLPLTMPVGARDLVRRLLHRDPSKRLGSGINGWQDVKTHPWFEDINWELLTLRPSLSGPFGTYKAKEDGSCTSEDESSDEEPAWWKTGIAAVKFESDLKRECRYVEAVRATTDFEAGPNPHSNSVRVPRHPLWSKWKMRRNLGAYACGEGRKSTTPLSLESQEPLSIPDVKNGNTSYVPNSSTEGHQWLPKSDSPLFRERAETGFWRKLASRLKFWQKRE